MERVLQWLRTLGTTGAMANARALSEQRHLEEAIVAGLLNRLEVVEAPPAAA